MQEETEQRGGAWQTFWRVATVLGVLAALITIVIGLDQLGIIQVLPGSAASPAERAAWLRISEGQNRCEALRAFLREHPDGAHAKEAETLLLARTERTVDDWGPYSIPSLVTGSSSLEQRDGRGAACQSARESAARNAESGCSIYRSDTARFRDISVVMAEPECDCRDHAIRIDGPGSELIEPVWRCTVRSTYQCRGQSLQQRSQEYCGE